MTESDLKVVALCGGVGGAKLAYGLNRLLGAKLSVVVDRDVARQRQLGCSVFKSEGIGRDIDCPTDFGPHLISPKNLGLTGSFPNELKIAERFGVDDAPASLGLF